MANPAASNAIGDVMFFMARFIRNPAPACAKAP
jgi:hypothetical protein